MTASIVDPSATSLREAAFWVYVRQSLYNATISQKPLDLDFKLLLQPPVGSFSGLHPLSWLCSETAWANGMLWTTACVADFCFSDAKKESNGVHRTARWQELWERCQMWLKSRPKEFDAIGWGPSKKGEAFSEIWFTADWHGESACVSHFWPCADHGFGERSDELCVLPLLLHPANAVQTGCEVPYALGGVKPDPGRCRSFALLNVLM